MRATARARGDDPAQLPLRYARLINAAIAERPAGMTIGVHLCRGNFKSAWAAEGGYEPVAEVLFNELAVDAYFLEYDDERSGGFAPLRFVPKGKRVVLGLVSSKRAELEGIDALARRIDEAARYVPLDQLCLSPQCGFSSTVHGNAITLEVQQAKLRRVCDTARVVWAGDS
jgi:5-methyltetrahydropteroyltriglutamate--homocysteine methyltransferase